MVHQSDALRSIAARVRALLAKTTDSGCTESEAMSAMAKARELMDKYQLDMTDTELEAEGTDQGNTASDSKVQFDIQRTIANRVASYCDCRVWQAGAKGTLTFFGLQSDTGFATYLCQSLAGFVQRSSVEWALQGEGGDQRAFVAGATSRINERLRELTQARQSKAATAALTSDRRSLIVVKQDIVGREFAKLGLRLGRTSISGYSGSDASARAAGRQAGDRASFGRPINAPGQSTRLIGRG